MFGKRARSEDALLNAVGQLYPSTSWYGRHLHPRAVLATLGYSPAQVQKRMEAMDLDSSGLLDKEEFYRLSLRVLHDKVAGKA